MGQHKLLYIAHHEAGHAVAAIVEGRSFRSATIIPKDDMLGHCSYYHWAKSFHPEYKTDLRTERRLRSAIVTGLAGHIAEKHFRGRANWIGSEADRQKAADLASYLVGSDEELSAYLKWLWVRTENLVRFYQPQITALASALLIEKTIQAKRVKDIFYALQDV